MLHTIDLQCAEVFEALASVDSSKAMEIDRISLIFSKILDIIHKLKREIGR